MSISQNSDQTLESGLSYRFVVRSSDTLFVAFSPVNTPAGKFMMYGMAHELPCSLLLLADTANAWYQECLDEVVDLIKKARLQSRAGRVIFWGYSMGAYGSLASSLIAGGSGDVSLSLSPDFVAGYPGTMSSLNVAADRSRWSDLRPLMSHTQIGSAKIFVPTISHRDGINVRMARSISHPAIAVEYVRLSHFIQPYLHETGILDDMLWAVVERQDFQLPSRLIASEAELNLAERSYDLFMASGEEAMEIARNTDDQGSENYAWWLHKAKRFAECGAFEEALAASKENLILNGKDGWSWELAGDIYVGLKDERRARTAYRRAKDLMPSRDLLDVKIRRVSSV